MDLSHYLLFSDLDRTLIPNGKQTESHQARASFTHYLHQTGLRVVYVSGRRLDLLQAAIADYQLPSPLAAIGDVGGAIYDVVDGQWHGDNDWQQHILKSWQTVSHQRIIDALNGVPALRLQEREAQAPYKISYYTSSDVVREQLFAQIRHCLHALSIDANLIWSVDEEKDCGLLDVMPPNASKLHAIHYLADKWGIDLAHCFFSGDSGNDLSVICDGSIRSILVNNATAAVKREATQELKNKNLSQRLYIAQGGYLHMNGNYAAGVLEGVAYFLRREISRD